MSIFKLLFTGLALLLLLDNWPLAVVSANGQAPRGRNNELARDERAGSPLMAALNGKSRQSRCVRCYEDRQSSRYGEDRGRYADDRSRYSGYMGGYSSGGYSGGSYSGGGYSSRSADDRSNWYYPSYDRYRSTDRGADRDYDRYYPRDDRYSPRTYDRYEGRGYDRGDGGYSSYDSRDRYSGYGDTRDRYYEPTRQGYGNDRDYYDRYYPRYDYRNYRPWDETYSGQSGFDSSGRGYYFAGNSGSQSGSQRGSPSGGDRRYLPEEPSRSRPCGALVTNCPYGGGGAGGSNSNSNTASTQVSSRPIGSRAPDGVSNGPPQSAAGSGASATHNGNGGWTRVNEDDNSTRGGGSSGRDRDRDQQSSSYGGRPPRPLGGSYLFDRDSNTVISEAPGAAPGNSDMSTGQNAGNSNGNTPDRAGGAAAAAAASPAGGDKQ